MAKLSLQIAATTGLWAIVALSSCSSPLGAFRCETNQDCQSSGEPGRCEESGYCSFDDEDCESGFRYGDHGPQANSCVGNNLIEDAGLPDAHAPVEILQIATGSNHSCALTENSTLCWGSNAENQLGDGQDDGSIRSRGHELFSSPAISSGGEVNCIYDEEKYEFFGANLNGPSEGGQRLSHCEISFSPSTPSRCYVEFDDADTLHCWGDNSHAQVSGDATPTKDRALPLASSFSNIEQLAIGEKHACAIDNAGYYEAKQVLCWGDNSHGQVGRVSNDNPLGFTGLGFGETPPTFIATGANHSCAISPDRGDGLGGVYCWGSNEYSQARPAVKTASVSVPREINDLPNIAFVSLALGRKHSCALGEDTKVYCWGDNTELQLGSPKDHKGSTLPSIPGLLGVTQIEAGDSHTCALVPSEGVYCWGANDLGQTTSRRGEASAPYLVVESSS